MKKIFTQVVLMKRGWSEIIRGCQHTKNKTNKTMVSRFRWALKNVGSTFLIHASKNIRKIPTGVLEFL